MTSKNSADNNFNTPAVPDNLFGRLILLPLKKIREFLANLYSLSNAPISAIDSLDLELINQTRGRLARMRFRHKENASEEAIVPDLTYRKDLQASQLCLGTDAQGSLRKTQKQAIMRWFAGGQHSQREEFERERETRFRDLNNQLTYQKDIHELLAYQAATKSVLSDENYEPLKLAGFTYEISPSEPLLIESDHINEPVNIDIGFESLSHTTTGDTPSPIVSRSAFADVPDILFTDLTAGTKGPIIVSGSDSVTVAMPEAAAVVIPDAIPASMSPTQIAR